jgi:hypothetical protein
MISRKIVLDVIEWFVIFPTAIVAAVLGFVGILVALDAFSHDTYGVSPSFMLFLIALGCFGIFTLGKLLNHFRYSVELPPDALYYWFGLLCGSASSIYLVIESGGTLLFNILFFGWPLLAVMVFSIMLIPRSRLAKKP